MSENELPVHVAVHRPDGTAVRSGDGFVLRLGELTIGEPASTAPRSARPVAPRSTGLPTSLPNYGRSKGAPIFGASASDLKYYAEGARRSLADPSKARFHEKERALLVAIEAEVARQGSGASEDEPPPPSDSDFGPEPGTE